MRKNCEIFINGEKINFCFNHLFPKEGNNEIKYKFKTLINSTAFMFHECRSLTSLDFSNFKSENVVNMEDMFSSCESLEFINFSNIKTEKVTNMDNMFAGCKSLKSLDLSNFNTEKVTNMGQMFFV